MKIAYLLLATVLCTGATRASDDAVLAPDREAAKIFSQTVLQADRAERCIDESSKAKGLVPPIMRDRKWIADFAQALADSRLTQQLHVFAVSSRTLFVDKDGRCLLSIEELPGNILRLNDSDYEVDSDTVGKVHYLLSKWPNQALLPMTIPIPDRVGARSATAMIAANL